MSKYSARELVEQVAAKLVEWETPIVVYFGKRRLTGELHTRNEVRFREVPGADTFGDPIGSRTGNPRAMCQRVVTMGADIVGRSTAVGADPETHRDVVRSLLHSVSAAVLWAAREQRIDMPADDMKGGVLDDELVDVEHGAAYQLRFPIAETMYATAWAERSTPIGHTVPDVILIDGVETVAC